MNCLGKIKKYIFVVLLTIVICFPTNFSMAGDDGLLPFGGHSVFMWPCTCSAAEWKFFAPLFLSSVPLAGAMVVSAGTFPFAWWTYWIPGVSHKGEYVEGVQACYVYAGYFCVPIPSLGVMAFTGSSLFR